MDFATKVKLGGALKDAADALLGTLWIHHGDDLPTFNIDEVTQHNHFRLEVKSPASEEYCDRDTMMFSFIRNNIVEITLYYDTKQAASKRGVSLVDIGVTHKHSYSEASNLLMAYYNQVHGI